MSDYLVRATAAEGFVRAFAVTSKETAEYARKAHGLSPVATAALGRTLSAGLMMGAMMKGEKDVLTIQFDGDGPLGGITVTADSMGHVKGYVANPDAILPPNAFGKLDVGGAVGGGMLRVLKDVGLKEPYAGEVDIQTGEIAQDLTYYFALSEQTPSVVALGVLVDREHAYEVKEAGGYILQLMPDCPEEIISELEANVANSPSVTELLRSGLAPEEILARLLPGDLGLKINDTLPVSFACNCSRQRVEKALIAMGKKELTGLIAEGQPVTLNCHFCNTDYTFSVEELKEICEKAGR